VAPQSGWAVEGEELAVGVTRTDVGRLKMPHALPRRGTRCSQSWYGWLVLHPTALVSCYERALSSSIRDAKGRWSGCVGEEAQDRRRNGRCMRAAKGDPQFVRRSGVEGWLCVDFLRTQVSKLTHNSVAAPIRCVSSGRSASKKMVRSFESGAVLLLRCDTVRLIR
jgi:hypothetical protein